MKIVIINTLKFIIISVFIMLVIFILIECQLDSDADEPQSGITIFTFTPVNYSTAERVYDSTGYFYYLPDPGYIWLKISLRVRNNQQFSDCINYITDSFYYYSSNNNQYSFHLAYHNVEDYLPECYNPQQTQNGFIAFEVPNNIVYTSGRLQIVLDNLVHDLDKDQEQSWSLSTLPFQQ